MRLGDLLAALEGGQAHLVAGDPDMDIAGLAADTGQVQPGYLFVAIRGTRVDAHDLVPEALARGATAVVVERPVAVPPGVAQVVVSSSRWALSALADRFYGSPARRLTLVGVTGTNGKTTVAFLVQQLAQAAGLRAGVIGTAGARVGDEEVAAKAGHTTPDPLTLHRLLREMVQMGTELVAMEVTSHGLDQDRVAHCPFAVAVFTNLTHDHLDYHGTMEAYFAAKARLFQGLQPGAAAVICIDDPYGRQMLAQVPPGVRVITYGLESPDAHLRAEDVAVAASGTAFRLVGPAGQVAVRAPGLFGHYNVANALAAVGVGLALGWNFAAVAGALARVHPAPGRFQPVDLGQDFTVVVDYAHTPDGFLQLLRSVEQVRPVGARVILVFGAAGHRDRAKRPVMGRIAGQFCDVLVLTEEDPRSERATDIMAQIAAGVDNPACQVEMVEDRWEAIHRAIDLARPGDIVLICGKGNETDLEVQHPTRWRGDVPAAEAALRARLARERRAAGD